MRLKVDRNLANIKMDSLVGRSALPEPFDFASSGRCSLCSLRGCCALYPRLPFLQQRRCQFFLNKNRMSHQNNKVANQFLRCNELRLRTSSSWQVCVLMTGAGGSMLAKAGHHDLAILKMNKCQNDYNAKGSPS